MADALVNAADMRDLNTLPRLLALDIGVIVLPPLSLRPPVIDVLCRCTVGDLAQYRHGGCSAWMLGLRGLPEHGLHQRSLAAAAAALHVPAPDASPAVEEFIVESSTARSDIQTFIDRLTAQH
jgi:hypothetical protein